jgi:hypothetical protein
MGTDVETVGRLVIEQQIVGAKRRKGRKRRKTGTSQRKIQRSPT